jgi:nitrogenase molybdenum-iron protein alpha/beta subunit
MSDEVRKFMETPLDLFVSTWCEHEWPQLKFPTMEFGFPSYRSHALSDRPFLGFNGFLSFVERMGDEMTRPRRKDHGRT